MTRVAGKFHFKALASRAFRAPGIENIRLSDNIQPEKTTAYELEAGISDLSVRLAMPKATVYRFLQTMKTLGYVRQEADSSTPACIISPINWPIFAISSWDGGAELSCSDL